MENKLPLISVITTVYNTEKYVERCFESIFNQTYKNIEFIIVNNASEGNINEIVNKYRYIYPDFKIKLVELKENVGLFHGRLKGAEEATGDYIAFIDSDDRVSIDFYRTLLNKAIETSADMIAGEVLLENENNEIMYENLNPLYFSDIDLKEDEIINIFFKQQGSCYYWHLVWNKIYRKDLYEQALKFLLKNKCKLIMCDDIVYSTIFYSLSKRFVNVHDVYYFYYKRSGAYTDNGKDIKKIKNNITDVSNAFNFIYKYLIDTNNSKFLNDYYIWKRRYYEIWKNVIKNAELNIIDYKILNKFLNDKLDYEHIKKLSFLEDNYPYSCITKKTSTLEKIKENILKKDIKYVSFDIFDTLLLRPFLDPFDLFKILERFYNRKHKDSSYINFSDVRQKAEIIAREKLKINHPGYEDINLNEIYKEIYGLIKISFEELDELKQYEIELENKFLYPRKNGKILFDLAKLFGKKIICISDMYLPEKVLKTILDKNGYTNIDKIYVSSEIRETKSSGNLYKYVLNDIGISPNEIVHIGDNYYSDITKALENKIQAYCLYKTSDILKNNVHDIFGGNVYNKVFEAHRYNEALDFLGIKSMLAVVANKLFDNPYNNFNSLSDYNANPYVIGYFPLGMYLFSVTKWLMDNVKGKGYDRIHFIARDGYLIKQAYDILTINNKDQYPKSNYLYVSRKALLPLMITKKNDIYSIVDVINFYNNTPKTIINLLKPILLEENYEQVCSTHGFKWKKTFNNEIEIYKFINFLSEKLYSQEKINKYRIKMKKYFSDFIMKNDCTFDIGYSGRTESILSLLLNKKIDAYYIHDNLRSYNNREKFNINIFTFMNEAPLIKGPIRELFLSSIEPSCIGYKDINGNVFPAFDIEKLSFNEKFIIENIQKGVLDFINDMNNIFKEDTQCLDFRYKDATLPFEEFILNMNSFDKKLLDCMAFEDSLFLGKVQITNMLIQNNEFANNVNLNSITRIERFLYYLSVDRGTLKFKVKEKLKNHLILTYLAKYSYKTARRIYRFWRNK